MTPEIRNVGIIAHVDHGKTTLVDAIFRQAGLFRENQVMQDRVMDRNDLEREKGITILSKVASVRYKNYKVNIVDTPGHADFGGEVERVLSMVDGVLLIVDACEGPMPQTRFVLKKALENGLKSIICINKIDREGARPMEAYDKTLDLLIDLGADEDDLFCPHIFTSGHGGFARVSVDGGEQDMRPLLDMIVNAVPAPTGDPAAPMVLQVNNLDYSDYLGRMFGGKLLGGTIKINDRLQLRREGKATGFNVTKLWVYEGVKLAEVEEISAGEIAMMSGLSDVLISDTICDPQNPVDLEPIRVEPPTLSMEFYANNSPLSGKDDGKFLTIHKIRERLQKEADVSVALTVDAEASGEMVRVNARGELQLAVLIETMRRESYELAISRPRVIFMRDENGEVQEPVERVTLEIPEDSVGPVMEELSRRKGDLEDMVTEPNGTVRLVYRLPTRGLIGLRSTFLTLTRGLGLISNLFEGYQPYRGEVQSRSRGALIAKEPGKITRYAYEDIQERGALFYPVGTEVYSGMIIGECSKDEDMVVNITKTKAANNMRSSTSEATTVLDSHKDFSLEQALSWLRDDELLEVTPKMLRFRKEILDHSQRRVAERRGETAGI